MFHRRPKVLSSLHELQRRPRLDYPAVAAYLQDYRHLWLQPALIRKPRRMSLLTSRICLATWMLAEAALLIGGLSARSAAARPVPASVSTADAVRIVAVVNN